MPRFLALFPLLLPFMFSCGPASDERVLTEITIGEARLFVSAETDDDIANPSTIRLADNEVYLYDFGLQKIHHFDNAGNRIRMFGEQGQGPGEFQGLAGFWVFDDEITAFDQRGAKLLYFSRDGRFLNEEAIDRDNFEPGLIMTGPGQLIVPQNGRDGKLAKYKDITGGQSFTFGEAETEASDFNPGAISQSLERGNLPSYMLGRISVAAGDDRIYLFHIATGKLQAFNKEGSLQAETVLDLPVMEKIKDEFFEHSRNALEQGFFILFSYINSMKATENGVALLLNSPADHPVTVFTLDKSLQNQTAFYYDYEILGRVQTIDIDETNNTIYFVNMGTSEVFRAPWGVQ
jgi:hypothetical protein